MTAIFLDYVDVLESYELADEDIKIITKKKPSRKEVG